MTKKRPVLFISDLHLSEYFPHTQQLLTKLLKNALGRVDAIYILGDFFEAWIGDDDETRFTKQIIALLKSYIDQGLPLYFLHGNRDFLVGKQFLKKTGCQLLKEEEKINLHGIDVLLMHGDTLCTKDRAYLKARKKIRHPLTKQLFLLQPLRLRRYIANKMRKNSERYVKLATPEIMDVAEDAVLAVMKKHQVQYLIHGHTHRPNVHEFSVEGKAYERIVLGDWQTKAKILVWSASGERKLLTIGLDETMIF